MIAVLSNWPVPVDAFLGICLFPLAILVLISGLDDLILAVACLADWWRKRRFGIRMVHPPERELCALEEKRLAVFVPCWHESAVIANMVEHNVAAIGYHNYDFFIGAYPNDQDTVEVLQRLEARFPNVHAAVCPHDGPTSKADCLNWVYQRMLLFEESNGVHYDAIVTHDAEDLIHPRSFRIANYHLDQNDMVQIPVLALHTPFWQFTHGLYCDDFAEFQLKDMRARGIMGSFIPSNGVGTAYARRALELLAQSAGNRVFEPECLTEDYENGIRLHQLGCRQMFVPISGEPGDLVATREFFPSSVSSAIRQRSRWLTGITLQAWQRHGWRGGLIQRYWFWRDRKGILGAPLSLVTNILFLAGFATWLYAKFMGRAWGLPMQHIPPWILPSTLGLQAIHMAIRMGCVARIYSWRFALAVPLRVLLGNYINAAGRQPGALPLSVISSAPAAVSVG